MASVADIKRYLEAVAELQAGHPGQSPARWLLDNGEPMGPNIKRPKGVRLRVIKQCYANSTKALWDEVLKDTVDNWTYAEGYAVSDRLGVPIEHAWLVNEHGEVIDLTWRNEPGTVHYFGVPFSRDYLNATLLRTGYYGLLWGHGMFNEALFTDDPADYRAWPLAYYPEEEKEYA